MKPSGFTLFELLITLSVLSVTLSIAVPQLRDSLVQAEVDSTSQQLLASISRTRHEAIKRNTFVVMSARGKWENGWEIFEDRNQNAVLDAGEAVLFTYAKQSKIKIQGNNILSSYIGYGSTGRSRQASGAFLAGSLLICGTRRTKKIVVNAGGRIRVDGIQGIECADN
ncbi:GspH/FimT family pseudopilin [Stutzerimonas sp. R40042]|uniref:GspH/FimT family pseudopilin n=1 Tax=Stutzerimonas sp. R40042 TaxID=2998559 RepID=UPI0010604AC8|nr:GspH/FimT family pseudopilin [Stutzerimonas sp. R40042]TDL96583.1 prepilin-type N-terminal cleavage/methylation domain-containing protein [Stutzerimonas stutzeri ATCC 17588 = LMG 11199]WAE62868.1 GspH/FimT family pseudopilin [Stutzerimonas sp. R40042]